MAAASRLPAPMLPGNYQSLRDSCMVNAKFKTLVSEATGYDWVDDAKPDAPRPKYGYASAVPGSRLLLKFSTKVRRSKFLVVGMSPDLPCGQGPVEDSCMAHSSAPRCAAVGLMCCVASGLPGCCCCTQVAVLGTKERGPLWFVRASSPL